MARPFLLPALIAAGVALAAPAPALAADLHGHPEGGEPRTGKQAIRLARDLRAGTGVRTGRELSPALRSLAERLPELEGAERRRAERLLARPTAGEANPDEATYTVPEAPAHCGQHFCVHYVATTTAGPPAADQCRHPADDRPDLTDSDGDGVADYVETMLAEFERVYEVQNNQLGWRTPKPDLGRGGDDRTDVYIKNIGPEGIFGYAAPDARQPAVGNQRAAYLVMDNDYCQQEFRNYSHFLEPLQVTAAHEYNHVLQFAYDAAQDNWMFESTAVWMEDRVYDEINDYRNYLPRWAALTLVPLTQFDAQPTEDNPNNVKAYGDVVWNRWIDERLGPDVIRRAWEVSVQARSFAPGAYDRALRERGTPFFDAFTRFAADTAEWRAASFEEGSSFPDVQRALRGDALAPQTATGARNDYVQGSIHHTSYALFNVDPRGESDLTLGATLRRGVAGAIALVGRTGAEEEGNVVVQLQRLPRGGRGRVSLPGAAGYSRVTAVLINSHVAINGYDDEEGDWRWLGDNEGITLALNDFTTPRPTAFSPRRDAAEVSTAATVRMRFDEGVAGLSSRSVRLLAPGGRPVSVVLSQSRDGRTVRINPVRRLARGTRYTVKLSSDVTDGGGNLLPASARAWRFRTRR